MQGGRSGSFSATLAIRRGTSTMRSYIGRRSLRHGTCGSSAASQQAATSSGTQAGW